MSNVRAITRMKGLRVQSLRARIQSGIKARATEKQKSGELCDAHHAPNSPSFPAQLNARMHCRLPAPKRRPPFTKYRRLLYCLVLPSTRQYCWAIRARSCTPAMHAMLSAPLPRFAHAETHSSSNSAQNDCHPPHDPDHQHPGPQVHIQPHTSSRPESAGGRAIRTCRAWPTAETPVTLPHSSNPHPGYLRPCYPPPAPAASLPIRHWTAGSSSIPRAPTASSQSLQPSCPYQIRIHLHRRHRMGMPPARPPARPRPRA